ncbi:hypothetical protein Pla22_39500 [Rubripirellula amarantea]|uniref:Phospholipid/glycerol acyltransferase domain-containing protein n=1 Tax=Rubripirellula amarantea TaxID=2527999 RepID=A0A5C5WME0_9BACT|nr:lysophospholipid acyltransferase family protein [Rubripirellula amarantea]TWT51173.1 hypothetical protein Pla22_39500 [Rubripirellula amarantea]
MSKTDSPNDFEVPQVADWFQNGFHRFLSPYLARHFHAIAVAKGTKPVEPSDAAVSSQHLNRDLKEDRSGLQLSGSDPIGTEQSARDLVVGAVEPVIVFGNHPGWWDPLIAHFLNQQLLGGRQFYAPIDASALENYRVFARLGFYGVDLNRTSGAAAFLKYSNKILDQGRAALWITPEGRFSDARDHSAELMPGLAHLCHRRRTGYAIAMAMEYVFWDERLPVCLVRFGSPISLGQHDQWSKSDWSIQLTKQLRDNQKELAALAIRRDSSHFENLLKGRKGAGGVYDFFRRTKSWITRTEFQSQHGKQFQ